MADALDLGPEPRPRMRPTRRQSVLILSAVLVAGLVALLVVWRPWQRPDPARLVATGATCAVAYGADLVVLVAEIANASQQQPATLGGVDLSTHSGPVQRAGGAIDIVSGANCNHVLRLSGDVVAPGGSAWVGTTVRVETCDALTVPVAVAYRDDQPRRPLVIDFPLAAAQRAACR